MAKPGNAASVNVSTDDVTYYAVDEINNLTMSCSGEIVDITKFTDLYRGKIQTLKDIKYTFSGFWVKTDTTGQIALRTAWLNDSTIYIKILVDASLGWKQLVKVDSITINTTATGAVEISFEASGNGDVTAVS
jgi:predicted secreted protein